MAVNNANLFDGDGCDANVYEELCKMADESEYMPYKEIEPEEVNHPSRYNHHGIETIDVIKAWTEGCDGVYAFCIGNAIKYLSRWQEKGGIEDIKKAIWYLQWVVDNS